jgi:iron complex outermembrane recepter protein
MAYKPTPRVSLRSTVSVIAALILAQSSIALAQSGPPPAAAEDDATEIIVTGTRIARPDNQLPSPITSFDARSIVLSGKTNLTDFLSQSPALIGSENNNANAGSNAGIGTTGLNLLDLRNLGTERTLVLIDGRRHVAAVPGSASIDINSIPTDLVERVDVVTGGASAIYGADGVTGVVNFIMKRNFEGLTARAQAGISSQGDAGNRFFAITGGKNFADGRGNLTLNYEYNKDDRLDSQSRSRNRSVTSFTFARNPDDQNSDDPAVPDRILVNDVRFYDSSRGGGIDVDFDGLPDFQSNGTPFDAGRFIPNFFQQGGSGTPSADYIGDLLPLSERHAVNGLFRFALSDSINIFAQGKYVKTKSFSLSQPTFDFYLQIEPDNPYIPASLRQTAIDNGGFLLNRDNFDFGTRGEDIDRRTLRTVLGFDGKISDHAKFEVSYVYGQSKVKNLRQGNRYNDRFLAALDAVVNPANGQITCRSSLDSTAAPNQPFGTVFPGFISFTPGANSGCVPVNLFGEGSPSPQSLNFFTVTSRDTSKITQHVVSGSLNGDFGDLFELPGGPIAFALGAEYRKETSRSVPAPEDTSGATFGNIIFPSRGAYSVKEAFAELNLPLLKDVSFAQLLSVGGAIRLSDYSTVGKTTTWKFDGLYAPIPDITFRATIAQAVRAPNIGELFDASSQTFEGITDPCDAGELGNGEAVRAANCAAILSAAGVANPATFNDTNSATIPGISSGNAALNEETARTKTVGVILQPRFLKGFSIAVDGYDIKLKNAITQVSAQQLADLCVDQPSISNLFCAAITRQVGGVNAGRINGFQVQPLNVASFRTRGIDFTVNYRFAPGNLGVFNARLVGGYLARLETIGTPGAEPTNNRNRSFAPKWVGNFDLTYSKGPLTLNYGLSYVGRTYRFTRALTEAQPDIVDAKYIKHKAKYEQDIQISYDVNGSFSLYGGVNNIFDQKPSIGTTSTIVDAKGRFLYVGAKVSFGGGR